MGVKKGSHSKVGHYLRRDGGHHYKQGGKEIG